LRADELYKNKAMLKIMLEMTHCDEESMHPPLLRWRQELNNRPHSDAPLDFEMMTVSQAESLSSNEGSDHNNNNGTRRHDSRTHPNLREHNHYPATRAELNAHRSRNVRVAGLCVVLVAIFSLVLYVFSPRYFLFLLVLGSLFYCLKMAQARRRVSQRADNAFRDA
jgi:Flp pilus assembly protein TadB